MAGKIMSTEEHLVTLIKQIANEQKFESSGIGVTLEPLTSAEDYPQLKFKIKIAYESTQDLNLFAKVTELNHDNWDNVTIKPYIKERLFYTTLVKIYRQLEDKHGVAEKDKLKVPACYAAETAHKREILVLEDLTIKGFGSANRLESVNFPYATAAVTELAKFHALSMAFKHESPSEFEKLTTRLPQGLIEKNEEGDILFESFKSFALNVVRNDNKKKLEAFFKTHDLKSFNDMLKPLDHKVIVHAHFWPKNMMHKVLDDGTVEVIPLDYQTIQVGSPLTDLFHFIYTASDAPFRRKHHGDLVDHYFSELIQAAARFGLDIDQEYSPEAIGSEIGEKLPYGLLSAVAYLPVLAMDDRADQAQGIAGDEDARGLASAEMYGRRLNEIVDTFVHEGVLQDDKHGASGKPCGMCFLC